MINENMAWMSQRSRNEALRLMVNEGQEPQITQPRPERVEGMAQINIQIEEI